jgi:uncharacterized protein involved in exopolysaccharide biosynthesis
MNSEQSNTQFAVKDIIAIAWRRKWLIVIPAILVSVSAFAASYLLTPRYETSTIVQVDPQIVLINEVRRLVGQENYRRESHEERRNRLASIYNELTSSRYTALVDDRLHLTDDPRIAEQAQAILQGQPSMTRERASLIILQDHIRENTRVSWASGDQIRITVQSTDPEKLARSPTRWARFSSTKK